ncbi:alpha/beta hydrolase [Novosphingobium sp.]|uniref:alpha/beta fold hydrolase n=1 Tax=Novosphingobium sp. TaxID=1874826 RepID=UPI00286B43E3|nr:alpha/beta hydrolase [Novosphingobium sp.]
MHTIETADGAHIHSKAWGEGDPVVLIHGWPLSGDSWDPISHALADAGYKAIAYDRRGFGRSSQPSGGYDYDTFADDLAAVLAHYDATENITLVGFSMGGGEIARYMSRHQGKGVSKVALISSVVPYMLQDESNPDGVPQAAFDEMTQGMLEDRAKFFTGFFKDFYGVGLVSHPVSDEVLHLSWTTAMQAGLRPTLGAAKAFATTDFRPDLAHFKVPTLVIHGTADKTVPIDATAREVAKKVPGAVLIEYDGEAHGIFASQTERLKNDLMAFIAGDNAPMSQDKLDYVTAKALVNDPL